MEYLRSVPAKWTDLPSSRKSIAVVIIGCLLVSSILFYLWATKVNYAPLYSNVQADSAGKIVEALKSANIPYTLEDNGQTIMVPEEKVYETRLNLASNGIAAEGSSGFELFDTSDMGATDFERNVTYQRALQEELRRSIVKIDAVKEARVHLVIPEKSAFIENQQKAQASIVLQLKPMANLQPEQVKAIAELVAGSVENLNIEDVKIIDTAGHILSNSLNNAGESAIELSQMELKRSFEKNLESRVQQLLESIYGPNKIVTMVTANLDFNQKEADRIIWGKEGVVASEQVSQTKSSGSADNTLPVGDSDRQSMTAEQAAAASGMDYAATKNYEINKVVEKEVFAPGRIISLSTAVAINGELDTVQEMRIKDIVSAAIGFDATRGDAINIMTTEFDQSSLEEAQKAMAEMDAAEKKTNQINSYMGWGLQGAGILTILLLGLAISRFLKTRFDNSDLVIRQPASLKKVEEQLEQLEHKTLHSSEDEKIKKILKAQPEVAAQIISSWLEEGGGELNG